MLGTPGGLVLVYMTQLPLFIAGLWLGTGAAALAGLTGVLVLLAASDLLGAAVFAAVNAVPVLLLVRQALRARAGSDGAVIWYPPGLLTAWLTGLALAGIAAARCCSAARKRQSTLRGVVAEVLDRTLPETDAKPRSGRRAARHGDPRMSPPRDDHAGGQRRWRKGCSSALARTGAPRPIWPR
jgi:hypothetical protein